MRNEFVKIAFEEYNSVNEQAKKRGFRYLTCTGISDFIYDFFIYDGKNSPQLDDGKSGYLQKCVQVVAKLCDDLPGHKNYKVLFDNYFTTFDVLHHFRSKGIHAVGTIRLNRLPGCHLDANKDLIKNG